MSGYNEDVWAEMAALSRRIARIEISLTGRILVLEAEVAALRDGAAPDPTETPMQAFWRQQNAAQIAIGVIMSRKKTALACEDARAVGG